MEQYFDSPIAELIKNRHSVRTYRPEALTKELKAKLSDYAAEIKGPFEARVRLEQIDSLDMAEKTGGKIGTYGVIKGAKSYLAGIVEKKEYNMEQLGYCMEMLMLYTASLGLGTCWLGGTFKRSQFAELVRLQETEMLPAVTPIGYPAAKRGVVESLMRMAAGSDNRKSWSELFFNESFDATLTPEKAGIYQDALEMVRLAPSASNKQPWRIVKQGEEYRFYLKHTKGYAKGMGFDMQKLDMGIAMCHFEMTAVEAGIKGKWKMDSFEIKPVEQQELEYIISWVQE